MLKIGSRESIKIRDICKKADGLCMLNVTLRAAVLCRVQQGLSEWHSQPGHARRDDACACKVFV